MACLYTEDDKTTTAPFPLFELRSTEIHNSITTLNQQNREYYFLRFSEVQKELSGLKVELGKID